MTEIVRRLDDFKRSEKYARIKEANKLFVKELKKYASRKTK